MKKVWTNATIEELNIKATAQNPTTTLSADDYQNGYFKQGIGNASGAKVPMDYYPNN